MKPATIEDYRHAATVLMGSIGGSYVAQYRDDPERTRLVQEKTIEFLESLAITGSFHPEVTEHLRYAIDALIKHLDVFMKEADMLHLRHEGDLKETRNSIVAATHRATKQIRKKTGER